MSEHPEENDGPVMVTLDEIVQTYRRMRGIERALAARELTAIQVALLATIAESPGAPVGANVRALGVSATVISGAMNRLEARGLVARIGRRDAGASPDRREVRVVITERGRDLLEALAVIEIDR